VTLRFEDLSLAKACNKPVGLQQVYYDAVYFQIKDVECFSSRFFFKLVTIARTGKGLEDDGLSGRGREVA
jgi:hypothetical protein